MSNLDRHYRVVKRPIVTEKATDEQATRNAYTFQIPRDANKIEVRQAVQDLFGVKVLGVNTLRVRGKARRRGFAVGQAPNWKKAIVTLAEGDSIDIL